MRRRDQLDPFAPPDMAGTSSSLDQIRERKPSSQASSPTFPPRKISALARLRQLATPSDRRYYTGQEPALPKPTLLARSQRDGEDSEPEEGEQQQPSNHRYGQPASNHRPMSPKLLGSPAHPSRNPAKVGRSNSDPLGIAKRHTRTKSTGSYGQQPAPVSGDKLERLEGAPRAEMFDVNTAIEKTGWGWYQHKVSFVMGIMVFADAAEIWLATIILNKLKCVWGLSSIEKALIPAIVYIFYSIGSIISGKVADKVGRFPVLLVNSYVMVVAAIASAFSPSYIFFLCCRATAGFCIGGLFATSVVYSIELMPASKRSWNMCILEFYWIAGSVFECAVAFFVMDLQEGWRIQILVTAVPCVIMLVLMHFMDESPRYLVSVAWYI